MKILHVAYLLKISRMAVRFYGMLHGLEGRDFYYKNPGVSLQSFIVARCLRIEFAELDQAMLECVEECEFISQDKASIKQIFDMLTSLVKAQVFLCRTLDGENSKSAEILEEMLTRTTDVFQRLYNNSKSVNLDLDSVDGMMFKQELFGLQDAVDELNHIQKDLNKIEDST